MCQATVFLDEKEIMKDVMIVEPLPEGVRLVTLFEPVQIIPASIRQIDLIKHRIFLESLNEVESHERTNEAENIDSTLD
ncbi:MAG: CooT family nickel-binding protein [Chloroflexota bacterium]